MTSVYVVPVLLQLIAQLRNALGGGDGQNVILPTGEAGIVPVDPATSITIPRTTAQVTPCLAARSLSIVTCFPGALRWSGGPDRMQPVSLWCMPCHLIVYFLPLET